MFACFLYLFPDGSNFSNLKLASTAISCANDMFFTPAAAAIISSKLMNFGGEAVIRNRSCLNKCNNF